MWWVCVRVRVCGICGVCRCVCDCNCYILPVPTCQHLLYITQINNTNTYIAFYFPCSLLVPPI